MLFVLIALVICCFVACDKKNETSEPEVLQEYTITYAGIDGAVNPNTATSYTAESGTITLLPAIKSGYDFAGWKNGTTKDFGLYGVFAIDDDGNQGFHVLETIYDLTLDSVQPANKVHVDNR